MDAPASPLPDEPLATASTMAAFELALAGIAISLGWLTGHEPWVGMRWTPETVGDQWQAIGYGLLAAVPMLAVMGALYRWPIGPLRGLRRISRRQLIPLFSRLTVYEKGAVSIAAGVGEELLFRGLIQGGLAAWIGGPTGVTIGIGVGAVVFGLCHWLSTTYAVLAAGMGLFFGLLLVWTGSLWAPIVAHAVYDFVALVALTWAEGRKRGERRGESPR